MRGSVLVGLGIGVALVIAALLARPRPQPVAETMDRWGTTGSAPSPRRRAWSAGEGNGAVVARSFPSRHPRAAFDSASIGTNAVGPDGPTLAAMLSGETEPVLLSAEDLDRWRRGASTNVAEWLAARQLGGGVELLKEALERFPNDPRVLVASAVLDDDPSARRERLDRLKAVDPDNALANYLSARDHLKAGRVDEARADLQAAAAKPGYSDYTRTAMDAAQTLLLEAGRSPSEATVLGMATTQIPQVAQLKNLAVEINALQKQYVAAGDQAAAENLANWGLQIARHLGGEDGGSLLIHRLVGQAVEQLVLRELPGDTRPGFLDGTIQAHLDALATRRTELREVGQRATTWIRDASASDLEAYYRRVYQEGELSAIAWIDTRQPPPPAP